MKKLKTHCTWRVSPEVCRSMVYTSAIMLACMLPEIALALPNGPDSLVKLAGQVKKDVQESGLMIAMNAIGLISIGYSAFNNFSKAPLISGILVLVFANTFFPFVNTNFTVQ